MQRLIIKSIHEHGFGFAFTHKEHDQVFLPRKLLVEAGITSLKPADELMVKLYLIIKINWMVAVNGSCTEIRCYDHNLQTHLEPVKALCNCN